MKAYHAWNKNREMAELTQCSMDHQSCDEYSRYYDLEDVDAEIARLKAEIERKDAKIKLAIERVWQWNRYGILSTEYAQSIENLLRSEGEG